MIRAILGGAEGRAGAGETLSYCGHVFKKRTGGSAPQAGAGSSPVWGPFLILNFWKQGYRIRAGVPVISRLSPGWGRPAPPTQSQQVTVPCPCGRRPALMPIAFPVTVHLESPGV